jgi:hypothetical protein
MTYYTGVVADEAALQTTIETIATTYHGWTKTGNVLHKSNCYVKIAVESVVIPYATDMLVIRGCTSTAEANLMPEKRSIMIPVSYWPITYYLFAYTSPDMIVCVVKYNTVYIQVIMFGEIVKNFPGTVSYTGGNFAWATCQQDRMDDVPNIASADVNNLNGGDAGFYGTQLSCIPFTHIATGSGATHADCIHVEIDGNMWGHSQTIYTDTTTSSIFRSPNLWNSQSHLVPMQLQFAMQDNLWGYIGYLENIRLIRVDNYEIGDIVTITPDEWKVFPWHIKNTVYRNGVYNIESSGTFGLALKYN